MFSNQNVGIKAIKLIVNEVEENFITRDAERILKNKPQSTDIKKQ